MPHKSRLGELTIDCPPDRFEAGIAFWSAALGWEASREGCSDNYAVLKSPEGEVSVNVQRIDHEPRVHLDIETNDIPAEVARLEKLGAVKVGEGRAWTIMRAPTGHGFCVVNPQRSTFEAAANPWP
ncbi:MAG: hypothetical protein MI723_08620 [Caulobacterales bacterium]|nr:hypothetical protein [Caulobacterales bacterium]